MRRSQAPSMRRAAKNGTAACEVDATSKVCGPLEMKWGTAEGYKSMGPRRYDEGEDPLKNKRIFVVIWRNQSNKKHKTWTGNGTLEVTETKATLKDETGKVIGYLTGFKQEKMQVDALLEIGTKDVELQVELKTAEECVAQRKEEIENWYCKQVESDGLICQGNDSASRPTRPQIMLKKPKLMQEAKSLPENSSCGSHVAVARLNLKEYICMLAPADLQVQTLQLLAEHCHGLNMAATSIIEIAQQICDHPVLLKHMVHHSVVSQLLQPHLPPWQELGLYDSAKFEFVHLMLDNLVVARGEKCAIIANTQICLDIIKGYCQCWEIPHIQLEDSMQADCFNASTADQHSETPLVALLVASNLPAIHLTCCKYMIVYNYSARSASKQLLAKDNNTQIYTLITAGCLEERLFQEHLELVESSDALLDLLNTQVNATHELLGAGQNILTNWNQWQPPFSEAFLKETFFSDEMTSLNFVFSKQHEFVAEL